MAPGLLQKNVIDPQSKPFPESASATGLGLFTRRLYCSFCALLTVLLLFTYIAAWAFYPWRPLAELDVPGWIVDFADQVDLMMTSRNPPLVILGSSLTLAAPRRLRRPDVYQNEISKRAGLTLAASCMAVPGAIASDQDFILSELLAHHKKPSLVVYTYAPRDFMDNTVTGSITQTPTRRVLTFINRRASFFPKDLSPAALSLCYENHAAFVDLVRRHLQRLGRSFACKISGHPDSLWSAAQKLTYDKKDSKNSNDLVEKGPKEPKEPKEKLAANKLDGASNSDNADENPLIVAEALRKDLLLYEKRYNPINKKRSDEQYAHLEQLLKISAANNIRVSLVGMPLSPANLKLLKPGVYQSMQNRVSALATRYGASLTDFNQGSPEQVDHAAQFSQIEFLDSAHLSTSGARHFVPLFVDAVVRSQAFDKAFPAQASRISR